MLQAYSRSNRLNISFPLKGLVINCFMWCYRTLRLVVRSVWSRCTSSCRRRQQSWCGSVKRRRLKYAETGDPLTSTSPKWTTNTRYCHSSDWTTNSQKHVYALTAVFMHSSNYNCSTLLTTIFKHSSNYNYLSTLLTTIFKHSSNYNI